jgi:membrane-bound ClpP family serine protease
VIVGLVLMILGLGLGVTMIMLPVGVVVGLVGFAMVVAGLFARIDKKRDRP